MTPETFRRIRIERLGLHQIDMAALLRIEDRRTISRYENGDRKVSGPVSLLMDMLDAGTVDVLAMKALAQQIEKGE